jgi:CHAT domain-containing protein
LAFIHGGLGEIYSAAGSYDLAREHLTQALAINRGAKLTYGQIQNLEALGRIDIDQDNPAGADSLLKAALSIADGRHYGKERSTVRAALARASALRKDGAGAKRWADAAVSIADSLGDPEPQAEARSARGVALEISNRSSATAAYVDAIELLESWRGRLALGDLRMGVAEPHIEAYEGAIRTLIGAGKYDDALDIAERARARLLLELMAERDLHVGRLSREDEVRQRLRERFAARGDASDSSARKIDDEIGALTRELDAIQIAARASDVQAGVRYPKPSSSRDLRLGLLGQSEALLVFFWGERDVYGWWVTRDDVRAARLGSVDSVGAMIDFMRSALARSDGSPDWRPSSIHIYKRLVAPLSPSKASEVFVVPDGPIATIPIETLMSSSGSEPWGADTRFVYGPSASVLLALSKSRAHPRWEREVLAVGNPSGRLSGGNTPGPRGGNETDALPPLPRAEAEARTVAQLLGGDVLIGPDATLGRWLTLNPSRYRYLHFATHTLLNDKHPDRTSLVLANSQLDLAGIRRLTLSSELVTLSACETGLGQRVRGEGMIGLPHAFLSAGARSVVVSLWKVEDNATADYMTDFYTRLRAGDTPGQAMLAVRRSRIRATGARAQPSSWAPFILVGLSDSMTGH